MRGPFVLLLPALLLAGCGDSLWSDLRPGAGPASLAEAEPAGPALRLTIRGRVTHARLVQETGARRLWRTQALQVVETEGARVVATAGFGEILVTTRFEGPDPLSDPTALLERPAVARRLVDLMRADRRPEGMRFGVPVECRMQARPEAREERMLLVEERCRAGDAGRFTNRFSVAAESGAVSRATQWIGPGAPVLEIEFPVPVEPPKAMDR